MIQEFFDTFLFYFSAVFLLNIFFNVFVKYGDLVKIKITRRGL